MSLAETQHFSHREKCCSDFEFARLACGEAPWSLTQNTLCRETYRIVAGSSDFVIFLRYRGRKAAARSENTPLCEAYTIIDNNNRIVILRYRGV